MKKYSTITTETENVAKFKKAIKKKQSKIGENLSLNEPMNPYRFISVQFDTDSTVAEEALKSAIEILRGEGVRCTYSDKSLAFPKTPQSGSKFELINELHTEKKSKIVIEELIGTTGLSAKILAENIFEISIKTLHNYKKSEKSLPTKLKEHAIKIRELYKKGKEIFGSEDKFKIWINTKSYGLNNKVPLVFLNSVTGIDLVYEELMRIEFGTPI